MYIEPTQMKPNDPDGYTIEDAEYIYGRKDPHTAATRTLNSICRKATHFQNSEIFDYFSLIRDERAKLQSEKTKKKMKAAYRQHQENVKQYGDNYTPRQQQLINGEIAYEDATGYEYNAILRIAMRKADTAVIDLMSDLLFNKREDQKEAHLQRIKKFRMQSGSINIGEEQGVAFSVEEKRLLYGVPQYALITDKSLLQLYDKLTLLDDPDLLDRMQFILSLYGLSSYFDADPLTGSGNSYEEYLFQDLDSLLDSLEKNTWFPISFDRSALRNKPIK